MLNTWISKSLSCCFFFFKKYRIPNAYYVIFLKNKLQYRLRVSHRGMKTSRKSTSTCNGKRHIIRLEVTRKMLWIIKL